MGGIIDNEAPFALREFSIAVPGNHHSMDIGATFAQGYSINKRRERI